MENYLLQPIIFRAEAIDVPSQLTLSCKLLNQGKVFVQQALAVKISRGRNRDKLSCTAPNNNCLDLCKMNNFIPHVFSFRLPYITRRTNNNSCTGVLFSILND